MVRNTWNWKPWSPIINTQRGTGFTLIEMVVVIAVLGILAASAAGLFSSGTQAYISGKQGNILAARGQLALERMVRDLRLVRSATVTDLTITPSTQISFIQTTGATVSYTVSGATLMRNTQPLADSVTALNFTYLQRDAKTLAASVGQVYYITAALTFTEGNSTLTLRATVHPRAIP